MLHAPSPPRLLLVDDDDVDREFLVRLLSRFDQPLEWRIAASLAEARHWLETEQFDAVLLDYQLKGELGLDLIPHVLAHRPEICPIILVTLRESESLIVDAMRQGVADYLSKSTLTFETLRSILRRALERAEAENDKRAGIAQMKAAAERLRSEREQVLREAAAEAMRAERAKSLFVANMSHEIRTPLNAVIGLSYLLQRTPLSNEQEHLVNRIKLASKSLLQIVNNVLDLSKLNAAAMKLEQVPFDLRRMLEELIELHATAAEQKHIALCLDLPPEIPLSLIGDPVRLHQVLGNLVTNAIKFTPKGHVTIRTRLIGQEDDRMRLRFDIEDSGIGIAPETLALLFKPFAQADASTTRRYGGTGLGLSIAQELTRLMGGELQVESKIGEGSRFWVELRFREARQAVQSPSPRRPPGGARRLVDVRVLLVDDSEINLEVGSTILEGEGARVTVARDGREAVNQVLSDPKAFDIVLMDLQMPVLDGQDAFRRIASVLGPTRPVVLALTAGGSFDLGDPDGADSMDGLMYKPFDVDELVEAIRQHLGAVKLAEPTQAASPMPTWPEIPGIDAASAQARTGGDRALFLRALQILVRQNEDLSRMLAEADAKESQRLMHRLKGGAAAIGATSLRELAEKADLACRAGASAGMQAAVASVCAEFERLRAHIQHYQPEGAPHAA